MSGHAVMPPDPRKERARATRRRMVEAAYRLFCEIGYTVPLTRIAAEANVAVQTIYFTFHTKAALLREALAYAVHGDDLPVPPHERPWFHAMVAEPDPKRAVRMILDETQSIYDRVGPLSGVFKTGDGEVAEMWRHSEELRVEGMRVMVSALIQKGPLKPGMNADLATDIVFVLLSPETYQAFVNERGWPPERWQEQMSAILVDAIFAQP